MREILCGNCTYFNGEMEDGEQFCDELESYVDAKTFSCNRFKIKENEIRQYRCIKEMKFLSQNEDEPKDTYKYIEKDSLWIESFSDSKNLILKCVDDDKLSLSWSLNLLDELLEYFEEIK